MCGIFGTTDFERYKTLYSLNQERGAFAYGGCYINISSKERVLHKVGGTISPPSILEDYEYCLGHTQGPTSSVREFAGDTSHPFRCGDWLVAHNGVLENDREIIGKYGFEHCTSEVDTSVIPALLDYYEIIAPSRDHEVEAIVDMLEEISGTYSMWIVNEKTCNIYLARVGSTLFMNKDGTEFSSKTTKNFKSIPEGALLKYNKDTKRFEQIAIFDYDSPYFIL
ncbi:hypothetical protein H8E06_00505 [bacterium]|nr:hypothetical protein [bacterium]